MRRLTLQEAASILRSWQEEERLIQFSICDAPIETGFSSFALGIVEEVSDDYVRLDGRRLNAEHAIGGGRRYGCVFSLLRATGFILWDARDVPPEESRDKELFQETYDLTLTIVFPSGRCVLHTFLREADRV